MSKKKLMPAVELYTMLAKACAKPPTVAFIESVSRWSASSILSAPYAPPSEIWSAVAQPTLYIRPSLACQALSVPHSRANEGQTSQGRRDARTVAEPIEVLVVEQCHELAPPLPRDPRPEEFVGHGEDGAEGRDERDSDQPALEDVELSGRQSRVQHPDHVGRETELEAAADRHQHHRGHLLQHVDIASLDVAPFRPLRFKRAQGAAQKSALGGGAVSTAHAAGLAGGAGVTRICHILHRVKSARVSGSAAVAMAQALTEPPTSS